MYTYKYFNPVEFHRCTPSCSIDDMSDHLLKSLDVARHLAGIPFVLNSAYRSVEWEIANGRKGTSSHTKGLAVDIACSNSKDRLKIVQALLDVGFSRIGIYKCFIHVDVDQSKPSCFWIG